MITHAIALQRSKEVNTPINSKIKFITSQEIQVQTDVYSYLACYFVET